MFLLIWLCSEKVTPKDEGYDPRWVGSQPDSDVGESYYKTTVTARLVKSVHPQWRSGHFRCEVKVRNQEEMNMDDSSTFWTVPIKVEKEVSLRTHCSTCSSMLAIFAVISLCLLILYRPGYVDNCIDCTSIFCEPPEYIPVGYEVRSVADRYRCSDLGQAGLDSLDVACAAGYSGSPAIVPCDGKESLVFGLTGCTLIDDGFELEQGSSSWDADLVGDRSGPATSLNDTYGGGGGGSSESSSSSSTSTNGDSSTIGGSGGGGGSSESSSSSSNIISDSGLNSTGGSDGISLGNSSIIANSTNISNTTNSTNVTNATSVVNVTINGTQEQDSALDPEPEPEPEPELLQWPEQPPYVEPGLVGDECARKRLDELFGYSGVAILVLGLWIVGLLAMDVLAGVPPQYDRVQNQVRALKFVLLSLTSCSGGWTSIVLGSELSGTNLGEVVDAMHLCENPREFLRTDMIPNYNMSLNLDMLSLGSEDAPQPAEQIPGTEMYNPAFNGSLYDPVNMSLTGQSLTGESLSQGSNAQYQGYPPPPPAPPPPSSSSPPPPPSQLLSALWGDDAADEGAAGADADSDQDQGQEEEEEGNWFFDALFDQEIGQQQDSKLDDDAELDDGLSLLFNPERGPRKLRNGTCLVALQHQAFFPLMYDKSAWGCANTSAYNVSQINETSLSRPDFSVSGVLCSAGYTGTAKAVVCPAGKGKPYVLEGCTRSICESWRLVYIYAAAVCGVLILLKLFAARPSSLVPLLSENDPASIQLIARELIRYARYGATQSFTLQLAAACTTDRPMLTC